MDEFNRLLCRRRTDDYLMTFCVTFSGKDGSNGRPTYTVSGDGLFALIARSSMNALVFAESPRTGTLERSFVSTCTETAVDAVLGSM